MTVRGDHEFLGTIINIFLDTALYSIPYVWGGRGVMAWFTTYIAY